MANSSLYASTLRAAAEDFFSEGANVKKNKEDMELDIEEPTPEEKEAERLLRRKRRRRRAVRRFFDRVFGFVLATCIMAGLAGLGVEYVLVKGPSPALKNRFISTMLETRRFDFIANIFLTEDEVYEIRASQEERTDVQIDTSIIQLPSSSPQTEEGGQPAQPEQTDEDPDGDGVILENISGKGFVGYLLTILDPTRVFVGMPNNYGGLGIPLKEMCEKYGALGGVNGGGFVDENGAGNGGLPLGLTIVDGVCYSGGSSSDPIAGFTAEGLLYVGYYNRADAEALGIVNCASFSPLLIINGQQVFSPNASSGVNPRTAIGQRADGAVLMLVIDGRQSHSMGATHQDVVDIMLEHGAVNACSMDGGSSTTMYYNGEYINSVSAAYGRPRELASAFLFR